MANVNDINCTLENFEALIAAIVAENCSEMYKYGRKIVRKKYYDPSDPEANNEPVKYTNGKAVYDTSRKTVESRYNAAKDWFLDPRSPFNTYWKQAMTICKNEETLLDGKAIAEAIDQMIEDVDAYPEDRRSFRQEKGEYDDDEDYDDED